MTKQDESVKRMWKTKGQVEAEISNALIQFEREYMGRGPRETRTFIIEDMVLVRLKGVLTLAEQQLTKNADGVELIKRVRVSLLENARHLLSEIIQDIIKAKVVSLHTDISTATGERIILFTLDRTLEEVFE
jgi:uncharacterized protein YbcI